MTTVTVEGLRELLRRVECGHGGIAEAEQLRLALSGLLASSGRPMDAEALLARQAPPPPREPDPDDGRQLAWC